VAGSTVTISGSPSVAGTFNYTVTTTGGVCLPASITGTIVSESTPTVTLTSAAGTDNQTVCLGSPLLNITYNIGGSATGATVAGLPPGISGSYSAGTFTISGNPTTTGTFPYTVTTTGGTCTPATANGTIFVQSSQITLTSAMYSNDQLICFGNAISTITYDVGGPVVANDLPAGVTATYTPGSPNTLTAVGGCGSNIVVGNIEVSAPITGNTSGSNTTVCEGSTFTLVGGALSSSSNPYTYEWQSATSAAGPFSAAAGINNASNYTGVADFADPFVFFRRIVSNGTCSDTAAVVQITIDSLPGIVSVPSWTICSSDSVLISGIVLSNATITSWGYTGPGQLLNSATSTPTYVPGSGETGTNVQIPFTITSSNTCAPATEDGIVTITILEDPVANLSGTATVCASGNAVPINGASVDNGTFSWIHDGLGTLNGTGTLTPSYQTVLADTNSTITVDLIATSGPACTNVITDTASFTIQVLPYGINPAINAFAGPDDTISVGNSTQLSGTGVAITNWMWSPSVGLSDSTVYDPVANPTQTTTYVLTVTDINGCMDTDSLTIFVDTDYNVFIPNLFSPNNDGYNDTWEIPEIGNYPNTQVTVINREGQVVYSNDAYDNSWDGTRGGKELPEATYYYLVVFENSDIEYKGAVTILRSKK
jgi:gliding motility-associated-like protein